MYYWTNFLWSKSSFQNAIRIKTNEDKKMKITLLWNFQQKISSISTKKIQIIYYHYVESINYNSYYNLRISYIIYVFFRYEVHFVKCVLYRSFCWGPKPKPQWITHQVVLTNPFHVSVKLATVEFIYIAQVCWILRLIWGKITK